MIIEIIESELAKDKKCIVKCDVCGITKKVKFWGPCYKETHKCRKCAASEGNKGRLITTETRKKISKSNIKTKGNKSERSQGNGYKGILMPIGTEHPRIKSYKGGRYIMEHILVVEEKIGRFIEDNAIIHHIDGDKLNNKIDNLFLIENKDSKVIHMQIHNELEKLAFELVKNKLIAFENGHYLFDERIQTLLKEG